jgi:hypothetical protein
VGSASVPGLAGSGIVDVAIAAWPFPLEAAPEGALASLGYERQPAADDAAEHRYDHTGGAFRLYVSEAGTAAFFDHVLLRDYFRHDAAGRAAWQRSGSDARDWAALKSEASAWWVGFYGFGPLRTVADELATFTGHWLVAGGWSLDLHTGKVGRVHHDVDVVVARDDQLRLQTHLHERGWSLVTPLEGRLEPWPPHMRLELPRHQVHAHRGEAFIDFLLTDLSGGVWRFRRQPEVVRAMDKAARRTAAGLPYLAPELALLFKSRNTSRPPRPRPQDQADFDRTRPHLDAEQRAWLRWALVATQPEHPWIAELA